MKKLLPLLLLAATPVYANIKQEFVTSAQISIDSPYVITNAAPSSYSISGNNITNDNIKNFVKKTKNLTILPSIFKSS